MEELGHPVLFSCFAVYGLDEHPDPRDGLLGHGTPRLSGCMFVLPPAAWKESVFPQEGFWESLPSLGQIS